MAKNIFEKNLEIVPRIFPGKDIQIILASHSPFVLSDLTNDNIVLFDWEKVKRRQKQNIEKYLVSHL